MSVKIATPTKEDMFKNMGEVTEPLLERKSTSLPSEMDTIPETTKTEDSSNVDMDKETVTESRQILQVSTIKKRRSSERPSFNLRQHTRKRSFRHEKPKHGKEVIKLPTKFLLGGNINDPLNLNSMNDEEINKIVNAQTPVSSPLPTPAHRLKVEVLIPPNINDPLNLNSGEEINPEIFQRQLAKKKKKHKRKKSVVGDNNDNVIEKSEEGKDFSTPLTLDITAEPINKGTVDNSMSLSSKLKKVVDKIVSPAIAQHSPKPRRKRTISEGSRKMDNDGASQIKQVKKEHEQRHRVHKQSSSSSGKGKSRSRNRNDKFIYGNYNRYYGKRNPDEPDHRLDYLKKEWFYEKDVLDIGCNIGHVTLSIAKDCEPNKIVGMDIDGHLISIARKNVKYYVSNEQMHGKKVPVSLPQSFGPVATTNIPEKNTRLTFPDNIHFVQGNYVFERDELLELQKEEYDVIMALSVTKWLHLNFGDGGIKRCFKRMYRQLRPGGKLILEPQSYASYNRKKNLNENILENYQSIRLRPEQFQRYLLSDEVGFIKCDRIETPYNKSKGFQRPIYVYTKPDSNYTTPHAITESRGVTPLMNIDCGHNFTPAFESYGALSSYNPNSMDMDYGYGYTPNRQYTPHWDAAPHGVTFAIGTPLYSGLVATPSQSSDCDHTVAAPPQDTAPSSAKSTPGHMTPSGHMTPGHVVSPGHMTPGHATPSGSQTSSSSCDTCCSASTNSSGQAAGEVSAKEGNEKPETVTSDIPNDENEKCDTENRCQGSEKDETPTSEIPSGENENLGTVNTENADVENKSHETDKTENPENSINE